MWQEPYFIYMSKQDVPLKKNLDKKVREMKYVLRTISYVTYQKLVNTTVVHLLYKSILYAKLYFLNTKNGLNCIVYY